MKQKASWEGEERCRRTVPHFLYPTVLCIKIAGETPNTQAGATQHLPLPPWAILTLLEMKIQEEHKSRLAARTAYHSTKVCSLADKNAISNRFSFFFVTVIGEGNAEVKNDDDADAEKDSEQQEKSEEKSPKR